MWGIWKDMADTAGYSGIYSGIQRDMGDTARYTAYSGIQRDTLNIDSRARVISGPDRSARLCRAL